MIFLSSVLHQASGYFWGQHISNIGDVTLLYGEGCPSLVLVSRMSALPILGCYIATFATFYMSQITLEKEQKDVETKPKKMKCSKAWKYAAVEQHCSI